MKRCAAGDTVSSLYAMSRKTCPCLDCKTVRSLGKLRSLRREHDYCTALQLISALPHNSYSVGMPDIRDSAHISPTQSAVRCYRRTLPVIVHAAA